MPAQISKYGISNVDVWKEDNTNQGESPGRCVPSSDLLQRPLLQHVFGLLVDAHYTFLVDSEEAWNKLVLAA